MTLLHNFSKVRAMQNRIFGPLVLAGVLIACAPVLAHHGAAALDTGKEITLKGTVTEWIWANPHCFLKFDAVDDTGMMRNWSVETQNPTTMSQRGWRRTSFKAGDMVTVTLEPVKNGAPVGRALLVVKASGERFVWQEPTSTPAR